MYQSCELPITSIKALLSTIKIDGQVRRWFSYLILQKEVRGELSVDRLVQSLYRKIDTISFLERIVYFLLLAGIIAIVFTENSQYSFLIMIPVSVAIFLSIRRKELIVRVCSALFKRDFTQALFAQKTLYQIGEFYGKKYSTVSLVDAMTSFNVIIRRAVLLTLVFVIFIYKFSFWQTWGLIIAAYCGSYGVMSMTFVYKRIK